MSQMQANIEELADLLAMAVSRIVTDRIKENLTTSFKTIADYDPAIHLPLPVKAAPNGLKRGRKPTPPEMKRRCSRGDDLPVLAKGLCRRHYYQTRRIKLAKEAQRNGGTSASAP